MQAATPMQALRSCWLLDTQPRRVALNELSHSLSSSGAPPEEKGTVSVSSNDNAQHQQQAHARLSTFVQEALEADDVASDYDLAMSTLEILKNACATTTPAGGVPATTSTAVSRLVQTLATTSVFADVRSAAAGSGLLTNDMALQVLETGRDDMRKAVLKARAAGLYDFAYNDTVAQACDTLFDQDKAQFWKVTLGTDPVPLFKERRPSAMTMKDLSRTLPIDTLAVLLEHIDHIGHSKWLQTYISRIEEKEPATAKHLNERILKLIKLLLYNDKVWISRPDANASKLFRYLFRRWGPEMTNVTATFNSKANPVISFEEMLRLSKYTSWDQQLKTFLAVKNRLLDTDFHCRVRWLRYMRRINKTRRSRHCDGLLGLIAAVTTTRKQYLELFDEMVDSDKLPPIFIGERLIEKFVPETPPTSPHLPKVFNQVYKAIGDFAQAPPEATELEKTIQLEKEKTSHLRRKRGSPPFREFLPDHLRLKLFQVTMKHKQWTMSQSSAEISKALEAYMNRCDSLDLLRTATQFFVDGLADRCTAVMILPAVGRMARIDEQGAAMDVDQKGKLRTDTTNLPVELLSFLRPGRTAEAKVLLAAVQNDRLTESFVAMHGREAWWRVLHYGLGGSVPILKPTLDPPLDNKLRHMADTEVLSSSLGFILVGEEKKEDMIEDTEFEEKFKNACSGVDLFKRAQGLLNVLKHLKDDEFRLRRMDFVAKKLLAEPDNTKCEVVPRLLKAVRNVQDFVALSLSLKPLWYKCKVSSLSSSLVPSFVNHAQATIQMVLSGALSPNTHGAQLARSIVVTARVSWGKDMLLKSAKKLLECPSVLTFMVEAMEEAAGPPETSPNYSADILSLTLGLADKTKLKPAELVAMDWAKALRPGLDGDSKPFVMHTALELLMNWNVLDWSPVSDTTLTRVLDNSRKLKAPEALELLRDRIAVLLEHVGMIEEHNKEAENDTTKIFISPDAVTKSIATAVGLTCQAIDNVPVVDLQSCVNLMLGGSDIPETLLSFPCSLGPRTWSVGLEGEHVISVAKSFLVRIVFATDVDEQQKQCLVNLLSLPIDTSKPASSGKTCFAQTMIDTLAKRQDIVPAIVLCPALALQFVQHRPALFRTVLEGFLASPENNGSVLKQLAHVLQAPLQETHLPVATAKVLAQVLEKDEHFVTTVCLASLLREVDMVAVLIQRVLLLEDPKVTLVLRAAANSGHPSRTLELCSGGTALRETSHRDVFDRALSEMPYDQARIIIEQLLTDPSSSPGLTKRMLRISQDNRLENPIGLLLAAFRDGKCHRDVRVFLVHSLALNAVDTQKTKPLEESQIDAVFDASNIPLKDVAYIGQQVVEGLERKPMSGPVRVLQFLLQILDQCSLISHNDGFNPSAVFAVILHQLVEAGQKNDVFSDSNKAVHCLTTLLERAAFLQQSALHGQHLLAKRWNGVRPDSNQFSTKNFARFVRHCSHETVHNLLRAMVLHLKEPANDMKPVISLWANALLRPQDSQKIVDSQVDFMLDLASQHSEGGTKLEHLRILSETVVKCVQADEDHGGNEAIRRAAIRIVTWVKSTARQDNVEFLSADNIENLDYLYTCVRDRVLLASRPGTEAHELISVLRKALECDDVLTQELQKKSRSVKNGYVFLSEALSAARSTSVMAHHLPVLEFLCDPSMRRHVDMCKDIPVAIKHHAFGALRATVDPDRVRVLLFPLHDMLPDFADGLFDFSESAAIKWVADLVKAQEALSNENKSTTAASVRAFSDRVSREAATILSGSTLPAIRLQSLRFLLEPQVDIMAKKDPDYNVRAVARVLIAARESAEMGGSKKAKVASNF